MCESTGLYTVRSIVIAALFHILRIGTPDFLVKIRRWIRCPLCTKREQSKLGCVVDDAYTSYLHDHSRLALASKFVEKRSHQTIKPELCAFFVRAHWYPKTYGFGKVRTIGACAGCTSIHAHVDAVLLVGSKHTKPRLTFECVLMAALNYVGPCFRPEFST
jgi:hypothetical protein